MRCLLAVVLGGVLLAPAGPPPASTSAAVERNDDITFVPAAFSRSYATGGDGNLWVADPTADVVRRLTPTGAAAPVALADVGEVIVASYDGGLWVTASTGEVWRIDPFAQVPTLVEDFGTVAVQALVAAGPNRVWAKLTPAAPGDDTLALLGPTGIVDSFAVPMTSPDTGFHPAGGAPDGSLWFGTSGAPGDEENTELTRVEVDGDVSSVQLDTGNAGGGPTPEDVTSLAFAADGTLWFTTYSEEAVTVSGASGGGIGRYAAGVSTWWPRPGFPETVPDATYSTGPLPDDLQRGPGGRLYFAERSADGPRLSQFRTDPTKVRYVEVGDYSGPRLGAGRAWWSAVGGPSGFGVADLDALFAKKAVERRVGLRFKSATTKFTGRVRAADDDCRRAVLDLFRARLGRDAKVRSGRSKANGRFALRLRPSERRSGAYYARARPSTHPDGITRCTSDKSRVRTIRLP
jgi:hypothetical protein